ncbi:MAG: TetR family transcriptional regulator [Alphaproteobacteria bacterium]|nr:TetR family transcriptional regulator [Alphaproteobacteria bacterium]
MARRRRSGTTASGGDKPAAVASESDRIIDAALARIPIEGWRGLSLASIAAASGLPILRVYRNFPSKQAILGAFFRRIDEAVLADAPTAEEGERARDRLFDLMMRRFDALRPYKPALEILRRELPADPVSTLVAAGALLRSMRWMHEAADITTGGIRGALAIKLTSAAYMATMSVWQRDDSADLGRTMAALDARLRRVERWLPTVRLSRENRSARPA